MDSSEIDRWAIASELLERILDLPEDQRHSALNRLSLEMGVESELKKLFAGTQRQSVLDEPLDSLLDQVSSTRIAQNALTGRTFGGWTLGSEIGRGGMSVVYEASRAGEGFEQHAALKILSIAFLGGEAVENFLRERKILSDLHHPHIARLIDGGITPDGAPYLVMDRVDGQRIDHWCKARDKDIVQIIELMLPLCRAVAHAQKLLVVHRDINPTNVLVDRGGRPVLVDFGIAKILSETESGKTLHAFTPEFAAPEQKSNGKITTATDVFGLGMLLTHLLRAHKVDRDLSMIIQVATHTDPEQRYANARNMSDDLQAWLKRRPVRARPDSVRYRLRKFSERNWRSLGVVLVLVMVLLVGLYSLNRQTQISRSEAEKHRVVADFMLNLFEQADLMHSGADLRVTDLLETAAMQARRELKNDPETLASLLILIASGQTELTNYDEAESLLETAGGLVDKNEVSNHTAAGYLLQKAKLSYEKGDFPRAVEQAKQAVALLESDAGHRDAYFLAGSNLVSYQVDAERYGEALALAEKIFDETSRADVSPEAKITVIHRYAVALEVSGELESSFNRYTEALDLQRETQPHNILGRAAILSDYGISMYFAGRYEDSETINREVLDIYARQFKPPHPRIASALHNVAFSLVGQERLGEAIVLLREA